MKNKPKNKTKENLITCGYPCNSYGILLQTIYRHTYRRYYNFALTPLLPTSIRTTGGDFHFIFNKSSRGA
jgi:hypothetical protein